MRSLCAAVLAASLLSFSSAFLFPPSSPQPSRSALNAATTTAPAPVWTASPPVIQPDVQGRDRLVFIKDGYSYWKWQGHKIHYVSYEDQSAEKADTEEKEARQRRTPIILIHGFGASVFHWRYNIPQLAKHHRVYAVDLLGFGLSDKPIRDYNAEVWREQVAAFLREVVGVKPEDPHSRAVLVGNSLGGYTALSTASYHPELVKSCAILNGAGTFDPEVTIPEDPPKGSPSLADQAKAKLQQAFQKAVLYSAFYFTKQPLRIKQVLQQVYLNKANVDDELVESIRFPSDHPNAAEVFCRVVSRTSTKGALVTINSLLNQLSVPLLLLWGDQDPWIRPQAAAKMQALYPQAKKVGLEAGHCPHDEVPEQVNEELLTWLAELS